MPGTTLRGYPYPTDTDPIDVAGDVQALAEAIDTDVASVDVDVTALHPDFGTYPGMPNPSVVQHVVKLPGIYTTDLNGALMIVFPAFFAQTHINLTNYTSAPGPIPLHFTGYQPSSSNCQIIVHGADGVAAWKNGSVAMSWEAIGAKP